MDREEFKQRLREELTPFLEGAVEAQLSLLREKNQPISLIRFLEALEAHWSSAQAKWQSENPDIELDPEYVALRLEVFRDIVRTLKLRASN